MQTKKNQDSPKDIQGWQNTTLILVQGWENFYENGGGDHRVEGKDSDFLDITLSYHGVQIIFAYWVIIDALYQGIHFIFVHWGIIDSSYHDVQIKFAHRVILDASYHDV